MATKTILDLYDEYKKGIAKFKKRKENLMKEPKKNKNRIEKINKDMIDFQMQYLRLWTNVNNKENKNEQT